MYHEKIAGLDSSDPNVVIDSALWIIENPEKLEKVRDNYTKACNILSAASSEDIECLQYINKNLQDPAFKAQLLAIVLANGEEEEIKSTAKNFIEHLIDEVATLKTTNTDIVAEVYSYLEQSGNPQIIEKARKLL